MQPQRHAEVPSGIQQHRRRTIHRDDVEQVFRNQLVRTRLDVDLDDLERPRVARLVVIPRGDRRAVAVCSTPSHLVN